jgi:uncharacterized protein (TIGR03067 family)
MSGDAQQQLEGIWRYVANEIGGVALSPEMVAGTWPLVLLPGPYLPGWDGLWALVSDGNQGWTWSVAEVVGACRDVILGHTPEGTAPAAGIHLPCCGRFRIAPQQSPSEIDLEQFWNGDVIPSSSQLGIYRLTDEELTLCLAESGRPRPTAFASRGRGSLGRLMQ